ncbi:hypothetical protein S40293_11191 [Stachybotrys chartarum IBT 40293]|nr:hypothetical protein S40293_11191 [Stachybotrys chartarum IBT 40293]
MPSTDVDGGRGYCGGATSPVRSAGIDSDQVDMGKRVRQRREQRCAKKAWVQLNGREARITLLLQISSCGFTPVGTQDVMRHDAVSSVAWDLLVAETMLHHATCPPPETRRHGMAKYLTMVSRQLSVRLPPCDSGQVAGRLLVETSQCGIRGIRNTRPADAPVLPNLPL